VVLVFMIPPRERPGSLTPGFRIDPIVSRINTESLG
jgi:hypothetical protein